MIRIITDSTGSLHPGCSPVVGRVVDCGGCDTALAGMLCLTGSAYAARKSGVSAAALHSDVCDDANNSSSQSKTARYSNRFHTRPQLDDEGIPASSSILSKPKKS